MRTLLILAALAAATPALLAGPDGPVAPVTPPAPSTGAPVVTETVRAFDPAKVEVGWNNRRWQLVHQGQVLKDFGSHEQEARLALRTIQELKLDGHGTIGAPRPVMEYWLTGGQAPRGQVRGALRGVPLEPSRLRVEQVRDQWCLRDGPRVLFNFGAGADEARQALAVLQKHQFDHVGLIGQPAPSMYVFLRRPHDETPVMAPPASPRGGGRQIDASRFTRLAKGADGKEKAPRKQAGPGTGLEQFGSAVPPLTAPPPARESRGQPHLGPRLPQAPAATDRVVFDWRQAQLRQVNGEWALQAGSQTLAKFGGNFHAGQMALAALRHYRFTEQRRVGEPVVMLYAATAQSPRGLLLGLPADSFQPEKLAVQHVQGRFALVQGGRVVLSMGPRKDEADKVLQLVQKQGYDRLCQVGDPAKDGMTFFVRSR